MKTRVLIALTAVAALAGGCSTTGGGRAAPVEATRYHLSQPIPPGTVAVQAGTGQLAGPEFGVYSNAVTGELGRLGFTPAAAGGTADYVAAVSFTRTDRGQVRTRPPLTIGVGGGSFGGVLVQVGYRDFRAFFGVGEGDFFANAAGGAGDDGDFVF